MQIAHFKMKPIVFWRIITVLIFIKCSFSANTIDKCTVNACEILKMYWQYNYITKSVDHISDVDLFRKWVSESIKVEQRVKEIERRLRSVEQPGTLMI